MLELLLILGLLIGVPAVAIAVLAGSAAYVEAGAERELDRMAADEPAPEAADRDTHDERRATATDERGDAGADDA